MLKRKRLLLLRTNLILIGGPCRITDNNKTKMHVMSSGHLHVDYPLHLSEGEEVLFIPL